MIIEILEYISIGCFVLGIVGWVGLSIYMVVVGDKD